MKLIHELRWNRVLGSWVIVSNIRKIRPWRPSDHCPFCPGAPEIDGKTGWKVLVIKNRFPALVPNPHTSDVKGLKEEGYGYTEVVIETPVHEGDLCDIPLNHLKEVIDVFAQRTVELSKDKRIKYVAVFRNKGAAIGVSITHPHSQIYALSFIPPRISIELRNAEKFWRSEEKCLFCDIIEEEKNSSRIIYLNDSFIVFMPFGVQWPFETHIYPLRHVQKLPDLSDKERLDLADALRVITKAYNLLFEIDFPYIMAVHQAPSRGSYPFYHLHIEFYTLLRDKNKLKYAAGIEWGFFSFTYDGLPEENAKLLRTAASKALKVLDEHLGEVP